LTPDSYIAIGLGYSEFLYSVGCDYLQKQQYQKAWGWFHEAAKSIYPRAEYQIGYMYDRGWGVKKDYKIAMEWYCKSARNGNSNAMCQIGYLYHKGQGVPRDYKMAMEWYSKSSENSHSQNNIGIIYKRGQGVPKDMFAAMKWYTKAAKQDNTMAQHNLAFNYEFISKVKNPQQAVNWYKRAADNGCVIAKIHLYLMKMRGHSPQEDHQDIGNWLISFEPFFFFHIIKRRQ
jgi:TPR repeat protein